MQKSFEIRTVWETVPTFFYLRIRIGLFGVQTLQYLVGLNPEQSAIL